MPIKLLYIHGLSQSGRSATAKFFEDVLSDVDVIAPDLSPDPIEALGQLKLICEQEKPDFIYAAQSAGVLAMHLPGIKKIIVNPFTELSKSLSGSIGKKQYKYPRKDGATDYELTPFIINHYAELESTQFDNISDYDKENTRVFFLDIASDEENYLKFSKYFPNSIWIEEKEGGDAHMILLREVVGVFSNFAK